MHSDSKIHDLPQEATCNECNFVTKQQRSVRDQISKIHLGKNDKKYVTFTKKISNFSISLIEGYLKRGLEENEKQEFCKLIKEGRDIDIYIKNIIPVF